MCKRNAKTTLLCSPELLDFYDILETTFAAISCPDLNSKWKLAANKLRTAVSHIPFPVFPIKIYPWILCFRMTRW
jgi:hypothetical protein